MIRGSGFVHQCGGRKVVRGDRRDAGAVGRASRCRPPTGAGRSGPGVDLVVSMVRQWAPGHHVVPRRDHAVQQPAADLALGEHGRSRRPVRGQDHHPVGVGAEPGAGLGDVVGDQQAAPSAELVRGRFSDRSRRRTRRPRGAGPARARAPTSARMSSVGSSSRVTLATGELGGSGTARAEVGDGGGHHEDVGGVVDHGIDDGGPHLGGGSARVTRHARERHLHAAGDHRHPRPAGKGRLGDATPNLRCSGCR